MWYIHTKTFYYCTENEAVFCNFYRNIDVIRKYYTEGGNPSPERQTAYMLSHMQILASNYSISIFKLEWGFIVARGTMGKRCRGHKDDRKIYVI